MVVDDYQKLVQQTGGVESKVTHLLSGTARRDNPDAESTETR